MELAAVQFRAGDICCYFRAEEKGQKCWRLFSFCVQIEAEASLWGHVTSVTKSHT